MTMQTATLDTGASFGLKLHSRTIQAGLGIIPLAGLAVVAPAGLTTFAVTIALSVALAGWSVLRVIRADRLGLSEQPSATEMFSGAALVALMGWLAYSLTIASMGFGFFSVLAFAATFAAIASAETVFSALACYVIKRFAATGSIGAHVAVMLNLQQKYAISLDGQDR